MKYNVSVAVDSRIDVEVEASSFEEAKELAEEKAQDMDLNCVTYCEFSAVNATDENERFYDYV